jgi:riboflavin kinase / FMN adenylyltransferase
LIPAAGEPGTGPRLIAIGNFDGVHRGHQYLASRVIAEAAAHSLTPTILTFDPHPAVVLGRPLQPPLTLLPRKLQLLRALSSDLEVVVEAFDQQLAQMEPRAFAANILAERYAARRVIVGENFRFGRGRAGNLEALQQLGSEYGFSANALSLVEDAAGVISSSRIRAELDVGNVEVAAQLLGRPHAVHGVVVHGRHLGRSLGFPTANFASVVELLPRAGVYACNVTDEVASQTFAGVCNLGTRPTVEGAGQPSLSLEAHLFDTALDLYGRTLRLEFVGRVRDERRFPDLDSLRAQISEDAEVARRLLTAD